MKGGYSRETCIISTSDVSSQVVFPFVVSQSHNIPNSKNEHINNEAIKDVPVLMRKP